jgi:UDP-N-acetylglucosamine acyltransferase
MIRIDPTATLDDDVQIEGDVTIGPYCVLEGRITIGSGTNLIHHVTLQGPLTIGRGNVMYPNVCIGFAPQDRTFDRDLDGAGASIGCENTFREAFTAHRATKDRPTTIGHHNYFMVNTHVGHDAVVGNRVTMANNAALGGHVAVKDAVTIGGNTGVHQFVRIGRLAMIGGVQLVAQDIPPFCVSHASRSVGALNLIGLRRAGLEAHVGALKRAFDLVFRSRLARPTAINRILDELGDDPLCVELAEFLRHSKRGISHYGGTREDCASPTPPLNAALLANSACEPAVESGLQ